MFSYSIDCRLTFEGDRNSVALKDFVPVPGFGAYIRQGTDKINLTNLGDNTFDLDFVMFRKAPDATTAQALAEECMSDAIAYPVHLGILASEALGVYNEDCGAWEIEY